MFSSVVVVVGGCEGVSSCIRISHWSRGEFFGMKSRVRGSPMLDSDVYVRKSARG